MQSTDSSSRWRLQEETVWLLLEFGNPSFKFLPFSSAYNFNNCRFYSGQLSFLFIYFLYFLRLYIHLFSLKINMIYNRLLEILTCILFFPQQCPLAVAIWLIRDPSQPLLRFPRTFWSMFRHLCPTQFNQPRPAVPGWCLTKQSFVLHGPVWV